MKLKEWLQQSNRGKHLLGGFILGTAANDPYCAIYAGTATAAALEFKDKEYGGRWDWVDFGITLAGVVLGFSTRIVIWGMFSK